MNTPNPYAPPQALVSDEPAPETLAGRMERLGACLFDLALYFSTAVIAVVLFPRSHGGFDPLSGPMAISTAPDSAPAAAWHLAPRATVVFWIGLAIVAVIQMILLARSGQTLGKCLLRIRIVGLDGEPASMLRIIGLRVVACYLIGVLLFSLPFLVDALCIFGASRRCLHDYLAGTRVVKA